MVHKINKIALQILQWLGLTLSSFFASKIILQLHLTQNFTFPLQILLLLLSLNSQPLISIIIPVYNKKKYLQNTLNSVFAQTNSLFELVCVDDFSTDGSIQILNDQLKLTHGPNDLNTSNGNPDQNNESNQKDSYGQRENDNKQNKQNQIKMKVIRNGQNKGLLKARQIGVEHATGEYILNLDADDLINKRTIEKLSEQLKKNKDIDIIHFRETILEITENGGYERNQFTWADPQKYSVVKKPNILPLITKTGMGFSAHGKLIKRSLYLKIFNMLQNDKHIIYSEDFLQTVLLYEQAQSYLGVNITLYNYIQREDGAIMQVASQTQKRIDDLIYVTKSLKQLVSQEHQWDIMKNVVTFMIQASQHNCQIKEQFYPLLNKEWKQVLKKGQCQSL
ncbi:Glycosyl_transferase family 2 protein [Hexamita inflata]|uniref:Glycosyl transferase family 2 protein n=1 Tax=Hexamita inflata TaxID=28002 RepID=A0AA86TTI6_9EUKA|nr:Glycosyl transferase family 2 protein [Hexamita inflata]